MYGTLDPRECVPFPSGCSLISRSCITLVPHRSAGLWCAHCPPCQPAGRRAPSLLLGIARQRVCSPNGAGSSRGRQPRRPVRGPVAAGACISQVACAFCGNSETRVPPHRKSSVVLHTSHRRPWRAKPETRWPQDCPLVCSGGKLRCPSGRNLMNSAIERAIHCIWNRYSEPLSLNDIAQSAILSRFHFSRLFKDATGVSPGRYLSAVRIYQAKRMLATTPMKVTEISFAVGFDSLGSFTNHFTESVGISPSRFRRMARDHGFEPPCWPRQARAA